MYLLEKDDIALIEREFYIVNDLAAKALIDINIIKPERIVLDIEKDVIMVESCRDIEVSITSFSYKPQIRVSIFSNNVRKIIIPPYFNVAVSISGSRRRALELPKDRNFMFEPQKLDTLSVYAHIVDRNMSKVFVRNDIDRPITLARKVKLGVLSNYEAAEYFVIDLFNHDLVIKAPKRSPNWIKIGIRKLIIAAAAFSIAITPVAAEEIHVTEVTVHENLEARFSLSAVITNFSNL